MTHVMSETCFDAYVCTFTYNAVHGTERAKEPTNSEEDEGQEATMRYGASENNKKLRIFVSFWMFGHVAKIEVLIGFVNKEIRCSNVYQRLIQNCINVC